MLGLLMLAAAAWAQCPDRLPDEYADDARSSGRVFLVAKAERIVGVYEDDALVSGTCFSVQLGPGGDDGPKTKRGDMRTPEVTGENWYALTHRNHRSQYYLSLGINYPNYDDVMRGVEEGVITNAQAQPLVAAINAGKLPNQETALGGLIFIHGTPRPYGGKDWTWGCVAVRNAEMDTLFRLGDPGTPVLILPRLP